MSQRENKNSIYVYSETLGRDRVYSVHAIADTFPMPSNRGEKIDDDKLIGIFITGKEEIDLDSLAQYPNLRQIVVGKDVKRVNTATELKETGIIENEVPERIQIAKNGKEQIVTIMSKETALLSRIPQTPIAPVQEKSKVQEIEEKGLED